MSGDLMLSNNGGSQERRGLLARQSRAQREVTQRAELDLAQLVAGGRHQEVRAILRKRFTEDGMQDITDVGHLAQELAAGDQFIASLLIPIAQEYTRQTARDIRDYGRGRGL